MTVLRLEQVSKQYGDKIAVREVGFEVKAGEIFGLLGANGAGKTTTMRMALGLIYPDSGRILWKGGTHRDKLRQWMGYLPEERGLYPKVKVSEQLLYFAELRGVSRRQAARDMNDWLERFGALEYRNRRVEELSKGNQQKIQFIAAVIHRPDILILDEAFSGLDPVNVELLKGEVKRLRDEGKSILFSSHRMDQVEELCENICILHRSNTVLKGNLREIKESFPREQAILETERAISGLDRIPGVKSVEGDGRSYRIRLERLSTAQDVLRTALEQSEIRRFEIIEPTLNEIFIRMAGEGHE
jgi:ABC-2 type transport system ATP-binding protein